MQTVIVAQANGKLKKGHPDKSVPGVYLVTLADDTPAELVASASLDGFHESICVDVLDDFSFSVHNCETGKEIEEPEGVESYENGAYCLDVAFFSTKISSKFLQVSVA